MITVCTDMIEDTLVRNDDEQTYEDTLVRNDNRHDRGHISKK